MRAALTQLLASKTFARSAQLRRFFELTVRKTLEGLNEDIKETTIAVDAGRLTTTPVSMPSSGPRPSGSARNSRLTTTPRAGTKRSALNITRGPTSRRSRALPHTHRASQARHPGEEYVASLTADYIVGGSFQRSGDRCRVSARLIRTEDDAHVWAEQYSFDWSQVFQIQAEIAEAVAAEIGAFVAPRNNPSESNASPAAYEALARGARPYRPDAGDQKLPVAGDESSRASLSR